MTQNFSLLLALAEPFASIIAFVAGFLLAFILLHSTLAAASFAAMIFFFPFFSFDL